MACFVRDVCFYQAHAKPDRRAGECAGERGTVACRGEVRARWLLIRQMVDFRLNLTLRLDLARVA